MGTNLTLESKFSPTFDKCMCGLAWVLMATVVATASILITLPEALEAVAAPAFGAPWITVPAPANTQAALATPFRACGN